MHQMRHEHHATPALRATVVAGLAAILLGGAVAARQQPTSFREAVDVIEFDVRVVTDKGAPILGLGADQFEVSLNGSRRRVVSAAVVQYERNTPASALLTGTRPTPPAAGVWSAPVTPTITSSSGRIFVLVVDASTFDPGSMGGAVQAARTFVSQLRSEDMVGLFVFPTGSQINPTTDRLRVMNALERITGKPAVTPGTVFNLRPSEVVALSPIINDRTNPDAVQLMQTICGGDGECNLRLRNEVHGLVNDYEIHAAQSLSLLHSLIANLADIEGRKTLVLLSGGIVTSNRPGGRPDIGTLDLQIGQAAIRTNTSIYTIFVDWRYTQQSTAERRQPRRALTPLSDDSTLLSRTLDLFTGSAGGALFKAVSGTGAVAFDRILNETSAYYVLGVEPAPADRDGKPRQLSVKTKQSGATVRGSRWVTVPRRQ